VATNLTELKFDDGQQVNVVSATAEGFTWVTTALELTPHGVWLEYHDETAETDYRLFLPWHKVDRIYQNLG
jgi:hypothetical protein